jgi:hypothetical protein
MNLNPATVLDPVFHFLDGMLEEYGVYFYLVFVWLSLLVLAWVFSGGLRRKFPNQPHISAGIGIVIQPHTPPPPTIIIHEYDPPDAAAVGAQNSGSIFASLQAATSSRNAVVFPLPARPRRPVMRSLVRRTW